MVVSPPTHDHSLQASSLSTSAPKDVAHAAILTLALSLPQGLLALPIAVAQVGLVPGLLITLLIGALNVVTVTWTAQQVAAYFTRHGVVPSLSCLAHDLLGTWGQLLAVGSGVALFFLALLASIVGLARSFEDLTHVSAPIWGVGCSFVIILFVLGRATIGMRLLFGLGLLNVGLLVLLILFMLPHMQAVPVPVAAGNSPITVVGVSLMLFFAPMLVVPVARHLLPRGGNPQAFVCGNAVGVAGGTILFVFWAVAVCSVAGARSLAESSGALLLVLVAAMPEARLLAALLGFSLLGMTALRCAVVLRILAEEQFGKRSRYLATLPAGLGLIVACTLLLTGTTSFTQLIAIGGAGAASLTSLLVPTLLAHAALANRRYLERKRTASVSGPCVSGGALE